MRIKGAWRIRNFWFHVRQRVRHLDALNAVRQFPRVSEKSGHGLDRPLVVTLTSYPPRYSHLRNTLRSLLDQTVEADKVILWLAHKDFDALPQNIRDLETHGLEIRKCEDLRSYKKLIPALREDPDRYFVTADDDIHYPANWLRGLVDTAKQNPGTVVAWRARLAKLTAENSFAPYRDWPLAEASPIPRERQIRLFPTGMGGVLYPPNAFHKRVCDAGLFQELAPNGDDIWFYWMARLAGMKHALVNGGYDFFEWPTAQSSALYLDNALGSGNDKQIESMLRFFGSIP